MTKIDAGGIGPATAAVGLFFLLAACSSSEPQFDDVALQRPAVDLEGLFEGRLLSLLDDAPEIPDLDALGPEWEGRTPISDDEAVSLRLEAPAVRWDELFREPGRTFGRTNTLDELRRRAAETLEDPVNRRNGS